MNEVVIVAMKIMTVRRSSGSTIAAEAFMNNAG
jgi:hypothetical protein